jgi:hypothetical protein
MISTELFVGSGSEDTVLRGRIASKYFSLGKYHANLDADSCTISPTTSIPVSSQVLWLG